MTYQGKVQNGVIVLSDGRVPLHEGQLVRVEFVEPIADSDNGSSEQKTSAFDRYKSVIGTVKDLPADLAEQHDHYIHGLPKKGAG